MKTHYAHRLDRSVFHLGQTIWQPLCGISDISKIKLSSGLDDVSCKSCQNLLVKNKRRFGLSRQLNRILREGTWRRKERRR